jgi:hypothetical protein
MPEYLEYPAAHIVSQSIFNISRLMGATLRPSLETDLLAIFRATHVIPLPNVTERPEPAGVNWMMPTLVSRDVVVEPPTQTYVELLGSLDIGHRDDVASRCISTISASLSASCSVAARSIGLSACTGLQNCRNDCSLLVYFGGSLDHSSDRVRLRGKDSVASAHFGDLGARTLIHPALKLRAYDVILGGQDRVAGLGAPCRYRDGGAQSFLRELLLRVRQD